LGHNQRVSGSILFATAANIVVAIATYIYYGWNGVGGAVAARNTARLSSVFFAVALASHFHSRFGRDYVPLIKAFVAAHVVHYTTVIAFHAILDKLATSMFWSVSSTGAILLAATALTIAKAPRTHLVLTYVVWLAFMLAFTSGLAKHMLLYAPFVALLVLAMVVHIANAFRKRGGSSHVATA
jgi:hypothetical protein